MPGSQMLEERLDVSTDKDFELPPAVFDDLATDAGHRNVIPALINGVSTHSGRKHCVYDTQAACDCGEIVTEDQRTDSACAVRCTKMGCGTEWVSNSFSRCSLQLFAEVMALPIIL
jgi:hypothetical protein